MPLRVRWEDGAGKEGKTSAPSTSYYRCCRYISTKCPGRCLSENGKVQITTDHNHSAEPNRALVEKFRKTLTHRAATENTELYVIYCDEATSRHAEAALLYPFTSAESAMRKARRKQLPSTPKSIGEVIEVLNKADFFRVNSGSDKEPIYQKTITVEDSVLMIFMHRKTFELFARIEELHLDASFEFISQTQPAYYMVTAHSVQGNITAPIVYAIFTAKTQSAYTEFFRYIREELKLVPNMIVSDFDQIMQASLAYVFPESIIKGCWFHYTDAVLTYMKNLGLQKETAKGIGSSALRMLLVLPLLPPEYMSPGLEALKKWMKEKNILSKSFSDLCDYVEHAWLRSVGAQKMSIFGATRIMSNHLKKFNKELASIISIQNPVIWIILDSITQLATKIFVRVNKRIKATKSAESNINGNTTVNSVGKAQKKSELIADTIISNSTQLWIKTPVHLRNTLQFLQLTSHFINDTMLLSYLSDLKETNYLSTPQLVPSVNVIPSAPAMRSISSTAVSDYQQDNWVHQSTQVQQTLDYIHQGTHHIPQNNYGDVTDQQHHQFMQSQNQLELQQGSFNHCYMQDQFSNLNIGPNHNDHHQHHQHHHQHHHQQQQHQEQLQQQQYLGQHSQSNVYSHDQHSQQQYLEQQQQEQFPQQNHPAAMYQHQHHQQQPLLPRHPHHHSAQTQQHHLQNQQQQQPPHQQHIQQQSDIHQQQHLQQQHQHQCSSHRIHSQRIPSEPPPLRMLPQANRFPCKRRLPLLSELPPLVPISSKRISKPA